MALDRYHCLFLALTILFIILWVKCYFDMFSNVIKVRSSVDGKEYKVQEDLKCPKCAANQMAKIHGNIKRLINHLKAKYPSDPRVNNIVARYNPEHVSEGPPSNGKDTSYSIAKGRRIVFCLRSGRNPDEIHDINTLMFVGIHELAHLASDTYGHNKEFVQNFKFLLHESDNIGVYTIENYYRRPVEFCGMMINSNPVAV